MNRNIRISIWAVAIAIVSLAMPFAACSNDDSETDNMSEGKQQTAGELRAYAVLVLPTETQGANGALFTDEDIEWFDVNTREIRFRDTMAPLKEQIPLLGGIDFYLDGECLFSGGVTYVGLICSQVFHDLVLCQGRIDGGRVIDDCYYLQDCYPLEFADSEEVKNNRMSRAAQWEKFTKYLESKGKLRK